jgi:hypothetical protein
MVDKIKENMDEMPHVDKKGNIYKYGEFFPIEFSPFGHNNSSAIQYFPMDKEEAIKNGYQWKEIERGVYNITKKADELPDSIDGVDDSIVREIIECKNCKNPYHILENEFIFYKKEKLPIPILCDECRFKRRIEDRLKLQLYKRKCMCGGESDNTGVYKNTASHLHGNNACEEEFETGYSSDKPGIIYCEKCYQQEVY